MASISQCNRTNRTDRWQVLPVGLLTLAMVGPLALSGSTQKTPNPPKRLPPQKATVQLRAKGIHHQVLEGTLFIPDFFVPKSPDITLSIHFQGARWLAEENFYAARVNAIHYTSGIKGLSSAFRGPFAKPGHLGAIIAAIEGHLPQGKGKKGLKISRLMITSFSAGYGAVREILKVPRYFDLISTLVFADSIYASYLSPKKRTPPPAQMHDFVRFAREAVKGKKTMVVTHSHYLPAKYCGTWETADYILAALKCQRKPVRQYTARGVPIHSRCDRKGFHLIAFDEAEGLIHADNFYYIAELLKRYWGK